MFDFVTINRLTENDFTGIISEAGGARYSDDDSREQTLNADYVIGDSIVELKLIEEEGIEKNTRQLKLSRLFSKYNDASVVVLDPALLSEKDRRHYFNIMEGPIKTQIKKASKQLNITRTKLAKKTANILIVVNNGYSSLNLDEFKQVVEKCARNDTSSIDFVISCGIYYYSDGFDSYVIAPFELCGIKQKNEPVEIQSIRKSWGAFLDRYMTRFLTDQNRDRNAKLPVLDIEFSVDDRTYVKPTPPFGKESEFYRHGRPRINSSGINECPLVARTFPKLSRREWSLLKGIISDDWKLKETYEQWIRHFMDEEESYNNELQPLVPVKLENNNKISPKIIEFYDLCTIANEKFNKLAKKIIVSARCIDDVKIEITRFIYLVIKEIGRDKKNDLSSIYIATGVDEPIILESIVENKRIFFEWGISLAAAYAVKNSIDIVLYHKDTRYSWI